MTESISTPNALVQTTNGKRFYVNSGVVSVGSSETTMIEIANIGERDIKLAYAVGAADNSNADTLLKVYSNNIVIFNDKSDTTGTYVSLSRSDFKIILPSNTSLKITLTGGGAAVNWTVAGYGKYV